MASFQDAVKLVQSVHPGYQGNELEISNRVAANYALDAEFKDAVGRVKGTGEIVDMFVAIPSMFERVEVAVKSITSGKTLTPAISQGHANNVVVVVDAVHRYYYKKTITYALPRLLFGDFFAYRACTTYTIDATGKIVLQEEVWSVAELVSFTGFGVGFAYERLFRPIMGHIWTTPFGKLLSNLAKWS